MIAMPRPDESERVEGERVRRGDPMEVEWCR